MFRLYLYFQRMPEVSPAPEEELLEELEELLELEEPPELLDELLELDELPEPEGAGVSPSQPASSPDAATTAAPFIKSRREMLHFIRLTSCT